jgi:MraZ protein
MFLGEYEHTIDDKGRITVPAKFRELLQDGLVVTKGIDNCLWLYPLDIWTELATRIGALPLTDPRAREFKRQVFGGAASATPDKVGRVNIPPTLRDYAQIDKQAIISGVFDHCEIWNPESWRVSQERGNNDPEGRAAMFQDLGI